MKKYKSKSLKSHLWLYFCSFATVIMLILWVLQIIFLGTFFNTMKLNEMKNVGKLIEEQYDLKSEDFYDFWFEHSFQSGMFATLVTQNGVALRNFNAFPRPVDSTDKAEQGGTAPQGRVRPNRVYIGEQNFSEFIQKVSASDGTVAYVAKNDKHSPSFAVYGAYLGKMDGEDIYLFLTSPLERTDATRKVLETQLLVVTFISIFLASVLAYFIAIRLSKPIEKTTKSARKLALGNYSVVFEKGDYREIDELSEVLNHAASELSKTEELRRDLISSVSHDLRTPLTIIKSYAELIRDISGSNEEKRKKHTEVIVDEANNLSLLVNDMLDLSKIQSGTAIMDIAPFDIASLAHTTVKRFEYFRENHGIVFDVVSDIQNTMVLGDKSRIEQAIYNLVANAVNYTGNDNKVTIELKDTPEGVRVAVSDNGCGIDTDDISRVWDKYYSAHERKRRETAGTGIGLSIVKNILLAHNAPYGVQSQKDVGSTFWFVLKNSTDICD